MEDDFELIFGEPSLQTIENVDRQQENTKEQKSLSEKILVKEQEESGNSSATNGTKCPENSDNQSPMRRSRRANIGHHWKYAEQGQLVNRSRKRKFEDRDKNEDLTAIELKDESDKDSVKSELTSTLEAFDDEIDACEDVNVTISKTPT